MLNYVRYEHELSAEEAQALTPEDYDKIIKEKFLSVYNKHLQGNGGNVTVNTVKINCGPYVSPEGRHFLQCEIFYDTNTK